MKTLILCLGILILQGICDRAAGQSTATAAEATTSNAESEPTEETGSGGEVVTTPAPCTDTPCGDGATCTPDTDKGTYVCSCDDKDFVLVDEHDCIKDPCVDNDCHDGETCDRNIDEGTFKCICNVEGYVLIGEDCVEGCHALVDYSLNSTVVNQNVSCAEGLYYTTTGNINVTFSAAKVGDVSRSSETCDPSCNGVDDKKFGFTKCVIGTDGKFTWSDPEWTDCSDATRTVSDTIIATEPETMVGSDVDNAVKVMENATAAGTAIPPEDADDILTITNNLLLAETDSAKESVQNNSKAILDSLDSVASSVDLTADTTFYSYKEEKSDVALAVVSSESTLRMEQTYYYGPAGEWDQNNNLAASNLTLKEADAPSSSYIGGTPTSDSDRISFKIYVSTSGLFGKLEKQVSDNLVLSASGIAADGYTFRFRINRNISLDSDSAGRFNISENGNLRIFNKLQCVRWDRGTAMGRWDVESQSCYASTAANFFATCKCTEAGEYSVRTIDGEELIEIIADGLSAGAIAGIVIGSVVGAALIGGGIYYFCFYKQKKKRTAVTPTNDVELRGNDNVVTDDED